MAPKKPEETVGTEPVKSKSEDRRTAIQQEAEVKDTVEVSKADLTAFLARLDTLESDNKKLLQVADKSRLAHIDDKERNSNVLIRQVTLSRWGDDGKYIIAWKMTKNESRVEGNRMIEDQRVELFFENGKSEEISLKDFYKNVNKKTVADIISRKTDESTGRESLTVQTRDGKRLDIGIEYVN